MILQIVNFQWAKNTKFLRLAPDFSEGRLEHDPSATLAAGIAEPFDTAPIDEDDRIELKFTHKPEQNMKYSFS